ncbi:MAG: nucleotidyltransferase domain-containing protein [Deltaproteobacteria bacterium]|nr:nucleotidyltransferase domain-containing protein [Deltaproteobacteria bacterium]
MHDAAAGEGRGVAALAAALEADPRFSSAWLFGSAARGNLRPDSDFDVGVVLADPSAERAFMEDFREILGRLGLLAGRDVHLIDLRRAGHTVRFQVFRTGRLLFDRDTAATRALLVRTMRERFDDEYARRVFDRAAAAWAARLAPGAERSDHG